MGNRFLKLVALAAPAAPLDSSAGAGRSQSSFAMEKRCPDGPRGEAGKANRDIEKLRQARFLEPGDARFDRTAAGSGRAAVGWSRGAG